MSPTCTAAEIATLVGGTVFSGDPERKIARVMGLDDAEGDAVSFLAKAKFLDRVSSSRAGALLIARDLADAAAQRVSDGACVICVVDPYLALAEVMKIFAPPNPVPDGIDRLAAIHPTSTLGKGVRVGPFVVVGARARIGDRAVLFAGVHVDADASVGEDTVLFDHVVVRHGCRIGDRCMLHPGVVVGADGFGFAHAEEAGARAHIKIAHAGNVIIEDDVEIGANACVDRGTFGATRIRRGTKIDNLVQIGHNADIGPGCILVAQSGVAGSSVLKAGATLGAQSGVSGHLVVSEDTVVYGQAGVMHNIDKGEKVAGTPAIAATEFFRNVVRIKNLESMFKRLVRLERLVERTFAERPKETNETEK